MTTTHTFNLTPNTATLEQVFRENLRDQTERLDAVEALTELIETDQHRHLRPKGRDKELILHGLYLLNNEIVTSIRNTRWALDECELAIEANRVIDFLSDMAQFTGDDDEDAQAAADATTLIRSLWERLRTKKDDA